MAFASRFSDSASTQDSSSSINRFPCATFKSFDPSTWYCSLIQLPALVVQSSSRSVDGNAFSNASSSSLICRFCAAVRALSAAPFAGCCRRAPVASQSYSPDGSCPVVSSGVSASASLNSSDEIANVWFNAFLNAIVIALFVALSPMSVPSPHVDASM